MTIELRLLTVMVAGVFGMLVGTSIFNLTYDPPPLTPIEKPYNFFDSVRDTAYGIEFGLNCNPGSPDNRGCPGPPGPSK